MNNEMSGEPALWAALVASGVQLLAAFWLPLSDDAVAGINAVVLALAGVWVAFTTVSADRGGSIKAAILGVAQALVSLAITFGWQVEPEAVATLMTFVGLAVGMFIRQTSSPKSAHGLAA